ncbi:SDR family oxidoreductase [Paractinoplanes rishiriensis]|uniref:Short-chain dehydrogenase n=1 Tax=Paractinoplanes rishiriensis TaxID=1050105 RepID=A0A919K2Z7_9ACTN|nr:SDR family NAD(P)-dependent oxidoreductase [Actinoplanes rishiriensis]GIE99780.1 short-chain dehydrogenase [Actinoplanes rishiriensis]
MSSADDRPVALVTGATRGTGRAVARELHRRGYAVAALHRGRSGDDWLTELECDLTDPGAPPAELLARFGRLDAVVCNAAVRRLGPVADLDPAAWDESVAVNLSSVFRLIRATLPAVRAAAGSYVVIGSHAGTHFFEGGAAYSATKAALRALVETLLLEERRHGVRATLVHAGAIANRPGDRSPYKMAVESVARWVAMIVADQPPDLAVGEIEIRPARLRTPAVAGLARLQDV